MAYPKGGYFGNSYYNGASFTQGFLDSYMRGMAMAEEKDRYYKDRADDRERDRIEDEYRERLFKLKKSDSDSMAAYRKTMGEASKLRAGGTGRSAAKPKSPYTDSQYGDAIESGLARGESLQEIWNRITSNIDYSPEQEDLMKQEFIQAANINGGYIAGQDKIAGKWDISESDITGINTSISNLDTYYGDMKNQSWSGDREAAGTYAEAIQSLKDQGPLDDPTAEAKRIAAMNSLKGKFDTFKTNLGEDEARMGTEYAAWEVAQGFKRDAEEALQAKEGMQGQEAVNEAFLLQGDPGRVPARPFRGGGAREGDGVEAPITVPGVEYKKNWFTGTEGAYMDGRKLSDDELEILEENAKMKRRQSYKEKGLF